MSEKTENLRPEEKRTEGLLTEELSAGYGKRVVAGNVSLNVAPGEVMALIGCNGAGKSTILKTIAGQLSALSGRVCYLGQDRETLTAGERAKRCAVVLTDRIRPENMTGRDVVEMGRYPYTGRFGLLCDADREKADEAIRFLLAQDVADRPFAELSDGQKQRLLLARAVCQEPQILVLDEPLSFLDLRYKLEILMRIRALAAARHMAVILSVHELDLARQVSDVLACVADGKITRVGTPEEVFADGYLLQLFNLPEGALDGSTGLIRLPGVKRKPEVFVICGGGSGLPIFARLVRRGVPFAAGILPAHDIDYPTAKAQAAALVELPAYGEAGAGDLRRAKKLIDACGKVLVPLETFGPGNRWQKELADYAGKCGKEAPCSV